LPNGRNNVAGVWGDSSDVRTVHDISAGHYRQPHRAWPALSRHTVLALKRHNVLADGRWRPGAGRGRLGR